MTERYRRSSGVGPAYLQRAKIENEFTPRKTMIILVIVVACFAVLWPKIFYPMLVGSANQQIQPSAIDKTTGCCYVLSETDVDTIKIMSELCGSIIKRQVGNSVPLTDRQIINVCQDEVYRTCGIDVSLVLQEQVRLGHTTKQILDEIRSLNGSLCLKYNFGVQPWRLGVPHIVSFKNASYKVRQERSPLVRSEMVHPAFRERGRAIPQQRPHVKFVDGVPGPLPGMRPTMGGPGHMVPPKQQGSGSMGIIMPIYTIGIVIFFTYTLMKIICKKHPETDTIYSRMDLDGRLRKDPMSTLTENGSRDSGSCKLVVNAMSALLEEVDQEIEARRRSSEVAQDEYVNSANLSNGTVKKEEKPSVKIMAMETTESCEDGKKWQSANSSVLPSAPQPVSEHVEPPKEIYLERTLPAQSQILVADSATETQQNSTDDDSAVVLAGKMTLSVISLENEELEIGDILKVNGNGTLEEVNENKPILKEEINHIIEEAIESIGNTKLDGIEIEKISRDEVDIIEPVVGSLEMIAVDSEENQQEEVQIPENIQNEDKEIEEICEIVDVDEENAPQKESEIILADLVESEDKSLDADTVQISPILDYSKEEANNIETTVAHEALADIDISEKNKTKEEMNIESIEDEQIKKELSDLVDVMERYMPKEEINAIFNDTTQDIDSKLVEIKENIESTDIIKFHDELAVDSTESDAKAEFDTNKLTSSPMLNLSAKSSSEDSGSTVLSGSNQGSVINVSLRDADNENKEEVEEVEEEEVSEEESEIEYEEEEIEVTDEDEIKIETQTVQSADQNGRNGLMNGSVAHNGSPEDEESDEEEIIEEIIEEYSDDEENLELNSN